MKKIVSSLQANLKTMQELLPAEDILNFTFVSGGGTNCAIMYADGVINKEVLGDEVIRPLQRSQEKLDGESVKNVLFFPEFKSAKDFEDASHQILDGNCLLLVDGVAKLFIVGTKNLPVRAITEPPTQIAVKGPREGFIEDVKTNMALVRMRLKTPLLRFEVLTCGKRSKTTIALCYLDGICKEQVREKIKERIEKINVDGIIDSSYVTKFLARKPVSLFKQVNTNEKPDSFCGKLLEGRVGILVDGSPIALTVPYMIVEDFQSSEDYYVSPYRATFTRAIRFFALIVAIFLPAFYVAAELFKLDILPLGLLLTIASSIQGIPLSVSLEMLLVLLVLEILNEASIRMPKYVGMALSVVGALVLGETAVKAGIVSTPAIIIIALSGICLYTVPDLVESMSVIRLLMLFVAGSVGTYSIVVLSALILTFFISSDNYGTPLLAPFSPIVTNDMRDSLLKSDMLSMPIRPRAIGSKNKVRLKNED